MAEVGFIGLGLMGEGMARRLLGAGRSLVVWNRSTDKSAALLKESPSVRVASTPAEVVASCDLIYCMLSTPEAVQSVYEMEEGILSAVRPGKAIVDCATLSEDDMIRLEAQVKEKGGTFLEAPVSGSKGPAASGQLVFLCGGDEQLFSSCASDLDAMGKAKFFFGKAGAGTRMKLIVNMIMGSMMSAFGEGLSLCDAAGLDGSKLLEVLDLGALANPMFKLKGPKMLSSEYAPNFPLKHAEKDMRLAMEFGKKAGIDLPVASAADAAMRKSMEAGHADDDFSAVIEAQKKGT